MNTLRSHAPPLAPWLLRAAITGVFHHHGVEKMSDPAVLAGPSCGPAGREETAGPLTESRTRIRSSPASAGAVSLLLLALAAGCDSSPAQTRTSLSGDLSCSIPESEIREGGVGLDGIPSIQDPVWVEAGHPDADYLIASDRVIGLIVDGRPVAIPHNILWWHEIVNLDLPGEKRLAVTYCPLTGTSMVFDRAPIDGATLGVSGLLFRNNLIMYDRREGRSLWPQMKRGARCGPADGTELPMMAALELRWESWRQIHPDTEVLGSNQGIGRNYRSYPYGDYESLDNRRTLFPVGSLDTRRPPKERVLGIPTFGTDGIAFPFLELNENGAVFAVHPDSAPDQVVVFWDEFSQAAMAYRPEVDGQTLTFEMDGERIVDSTTGSEWRIDGVAIGGPLTGHSLRGIDDAYVAFWFAWADFHPGTTIWLP